MKTINVEGRETSFSYSVFLGHDLLAECASYVGSTFSGYRIAVIVDHQVYSLYKQRIHPLVDAVKGHVIVVPSGEQSKSRLQKEKIEDELLGLHYPRQTLLIGIGGGMIGDLVGYVAATYLRGVPYLTLPTSLLAMVDSSIGGKTGVNTPSGKNLIGAVWQPAAVFSDLSFLQDLPSDEFANGMAEVIKIAATVDKDFFEILEQYDSSLQQNQEALLGVIEKSISLKKSIVQEDTREHGKRQLLNVGHTIGHGLEQFFDYSLKHGFCVSLGIVGELAIACKDHGLDQKVADRVKALLGKYGLPTTLDKEVDFENVWEFMRSDKKTKDGAVHGVLLADIGQALVVDGKYGTVLEKEAAQAGVNALYD